MAMHIRKGIRVIITAGDERGEEGTVLSVSPKKSTCVVQGRNLRTKHLRPTRVSPQGGIITKEAPIHVSNVQPVVDGKPTRVRFVTNPDGSKVAVAARGGKELWTLRAGEGKKKKSK